MLQRPRRKRLKVESLETRALMTGNVTATVDTKGTLHITGDAQANGITITSTASGSFTITGDATTTINGGALNTPVTKTGVTQDIKISMLDGADSVALSKLTVPHDLKIKTGKGSDTVTLTDVAVTHDLFISTGKGIDTITLHGDGTASPVDGVKVGKLLALKPGSDKDVVTIDKTSGKTAVLWTIDGHDTVTKTNFNFNTVKNVSGKFSHRVADIVYKSWVKKYD